MSCQHAIPQGKIAGHNVVADLLGDPMQPYRQRHLSGFGTLGSGFHRRLGPHSEGDKTRGKENQANHQSRVDLSSGWQRLGYFGRSSPRCFPSEKQLTPAVAGFRFVNLHFSLSFRQGFFPFPGVLFFLFFPGFQIRLNGLLCTAGNPPSISFLGHQAGEPFRIDFSGSNFISRNDPRTSFQQCPCIMMDKVEDLRVLWFSYDFSR